MAAPPGSDRRPCHGAVSGDRLLPTPPAFPGTVAAGGDHRGPGTVGGARGGPARIRRAARAQRGHRAHLADGCRPPAARHGGAARLVLAGHRPHGAHRRPATGAIRLRVQPGRRRLGGPAKSCCPAGLRQLRRPAIACLLSRGSCMVGDPGRRGGRGSTGRHGRRPVADQLPARRRYEHRGGDGMGSQRGRRNAQATGQAPGRVRDRAGDQPRHAAGVGDPATGNSDPTLWDPAAPQASRRFEGVIAASAGAIAWAPRCAPRCRVHVLDLATGQDTVIRLPAGSSAATGAFSPDGGFLAVQVSLSPGGAGGELPTQLEIAPVASGRLTVVPGSQISSDALNGFGWPGGGDSLVAELSFTTKVQVASWRPGRPSRPSRSSGHHAAVSLVVD